jgi:hypothetical protein
VTSSVPFDTLKFVETLEAGGFTHAQARAAAQAFADATGQELATKRDLKETETRLQTNLKETETRLQTNLKETEMRLQTNIKEVETRLSSEIRELELRMTIKLGGLMIAATTVLIAAIRYLPAGHP